MSTDIVLKLVETFIFIAIMILWVIGLFLLIKDYALPSYILIVVADVLCIVLDLILHSPLSIILAVWFMFELFEDYEKLMRLCDAG